MVRWRGSRWFSATAPPRRSTTQTALASVGAAGLPLPRFASLPGGRSPPPHPGGTPMTRPAIALAALGWAFWPTLRELFDTWVTHPEYSHGPLVPLFALYLLVKRKPTAATTPARPWPVIGF